MWKLFNENLFLPLRFCCKFFSLKYLSISILRALFWTLLGIHSSNKLWNTVSKISRQFLLKLVVTRSFFVELNQTTELLFTGDPRRSWRAKPAEERARVFGMCVDKRTSQDWPALSFCLQAIQKIARTRNSPYATAKRFSHIWQGESFGCIGNRRTKRKPSK